MAYKRITAMDIYEIIRRWHAGQKTGHIASALSLDRKTVRSYLKLASDLGLSRDAPLPEKSALLVQLAEAAPAKSYGRSARDAFAPYKDEIISLVTAKACLERSRKTDPVKPKTAFEIIIERYGLPASYSSFKRFVRDLPELRRPVKSTCRFESEPGDEFQIDYGKMGRLTDPQTGKDRDVYSFIAVAAFSRLKFVELTYKQDQRSFVASHIRMFDFFGGVPNRLVIDNLKAGVIKPDLYDPILNRVYQEMAEHYGTFIDPARPGRPKDKPKVERAVPMVREQFRKLKVLLPSLDITQANHQIRKWCLETNGMKEHGTTGQKPREMFEDIEKPALAPLPVEHFEIATWKEAKVHVDQYIQFEKAFYSVPNEFIGQTVWVKGSEKLIEIYDRDRMRIKAHVRSGQKRHTDPSDFPKNFQVMMTDAHVRLMIDRSQAIGEHFKQLIVDVLCPHAKLNTRRAMGLIKLRDKFTRSQLDEAARVAVIHKLHNPKQLEALIRRMQSQATEENIIISEATQQLIRQADYFLNP